jgi:2-polyprenyl-3-methyl-5-hydroxy-6-metoxy-1,4-benzoquinol methylase
MNPQPTWEELAPYYGADYNPYDPRHGLVEDDGTIIRQAAVKGEYRHVKIRDGMRVMDVGCGGGSFLRIAKGIGADVYGVEPNEVAAARVEGQGIPVFSGTLERYLAEGKPAGTFDLITASHVLEHVPAPVATLTAMRDCLAPGGIVWIAVPNASCIFTQWLKWRWSGSDLPLHLMQFSPRSLAKAATLAGMEIIREYTSSLPRAVASTVRVILRHRFFIPQKVTMRWHWLNETYASWLAARMDSKDMGEAIIIEAHPTNA